MVFSGTLKTEPGTTSRFPDAPPNIRALPLDHRGFPVPWFVQWIDGAPDFRVTDSRKMDAAVRRKLCWICGQPLGRMQSFVVGPMCSVNRVSAEPPAHPPCAVFAAQACPFLSRPLAKRPAIDDLTERFGEMEMPGLPLLHNPGATLVWSCLRYSLFDAHPGVLFRLGPVQSARWFREGREATRAEVLEAFDKGLPTLRAAAEADGPEACRELETRLAQAMKLVPK